MTKSKIPKPNLSNVSTPKFPHNDISNMPDHLVFSFSFFDRSHELFNLGQNQKGDAVSNIWFIDLLDCLKDVSNMTIMEMRQSMHQLHPVSWKNANISPPNNSEQYEYWQFRINKSKGRIIGIKIGNIFYVVWLDPHHHLIDSDGYGKAAYYEQPLSSYEILEEENRTLQAEVNRLKKELAYAEDLINGK